MSASRTLLLLISLAVSAGMWILGTSLIPAEQGGYGALTVSADFPDREIRERMEAHNFSGIVSESGQWVLVDSFGSMERVPLDEYPARLLPFDPRNDGYAEKLRSLFVRDGQRFIYVPFGSAGPGFAGIEKRLAAALGDIPFSFYAAAGWPKGLFLALFCLAASAFFLIPPLSAALRPRAACLLPLLPPLAPLALAGAAGFAMASLLAGCAALLAGPYLEWLTTFPRRRKTPPALCRLLPPIFLLFYGAIAFFSGFHLLFILPLTVFFCVLTALQLRDAYLDAVYGVGVWGQLFKPQKTDCHRFSPVPIFSRRSFTFAFSWAMLPFAVAAFIFVGMNYIMSPSQPDAFPALPPADAITEADYYSHYWFQSTFSMRSLHAPEQDMGNYELDPSGLLGKTNDSGRNGTEPPVDGVPPFSLGDLIHYLDTPGRGRSAVHTLLAALLPLLFVFPILFRDPLLHNQTYWSTLLKRLA